MNDMRGHNFPPEKSPFERAADYIEAANEGLRDTKLIDNEELAGRFQGFVDQLREAQADLEAARKEELAPHNDKITTIRQRYADVLMLIKLARDRVQPLLDDYLARKVIKLESDKAEQENNALDAQAHADRLRMIAERPHATLEQELAFIKAQDRADELADLAQKPVERARIKGESSDKAMSLHSRWHAEIDDPVLAVAYYGSHADVIDMVKKVASREARMFKDVKRAPPGVRFVETLKAQ